jgi:hypothetical protein
VRRGRSIRQSILTFWTAPSTWSGHFPIGFVRKIVQLHSVRPFSNRFCTKNRTTPSGPAIFQSVLYEKSYNSERSGRFPSGFVRKIVQLRAVRPFSKRFCTKNRTTPFGPAIFQSVLYEKSYNSERSGRFPSGFVRKIVQLRAVRPFSKRFCTKYRTTPFGPAVFQAVLYEKSYNSERSGRFPSGFVRNIVQLRAVRPFSKRFCTKNRTTPSGPAVFQAILYEISYNSVRTANSKVKSIIV